MDREPQTALASLCDMSLWWEQSSSMSSLGLSFSLGEEGW